MNNTRDNKDDCLDSHSVELTIADDFGAVTVRVNGAMLVIHADGRPTFKASCDATIVANGNITAYSTDGNVTAYTNGTVHLKAPAPKPNDGSATVTKPAYNIGDVLPDGWIVGPVSRDTGIVMSIEPVGGALDGYRTWHQGEDHAAVLRHKGNANARQPSDNELNALYNDVVKAGRIGNTDPFGETIYGVRYWSSTSFRYDPGFAQIQYFGGGGRCWSSKDGADARVRCVRDEPRLSR